MYLDLWLYFVIKYIDEYLIFTPYKDIYLNRIISMIIIFPDGCSQRSGFPLLESTRNGDTWC